MNYRLLGRTGLRVSEISLGAVEIGMPYGIPTAGGLERPSEEEAHALLHAALDMGINLIDTARAYGESEEIIGRALKGRRHEYILATKVYHYADRGLSTAEQRRAIRESIETSLRALQTDVIDILQIHSATQEVLERGEVLRELEEAQRAGKARFLGATVYGVEAPMTAVLDGHYDVIQVAYNMLDRRLEAEVLPLAYEKRIGVMVRSVLLKGVLTPRYAALPDGLAELQEAARRLEAIVQTECESLPEAAFRYVLDNPCISTALVGTGKLRNLQRAVEYAGRGPLSPELKAAIRSVTVSDETLLDPSTWERR